jgi:hypothetical protein
MSTTMTKGKRKKTTTVVEEIPEGLPQPGEEEEPQEVDFSLEEVRTAEQLASIMEQFPESGITAKLYDEKGAFCYRLPDPASIDEEVIRKRCGAGDFNIRIYANGKYRQTIPLPIRALNPENPTVGTGNPDTHTAFLEKALLLLMEKQATVPQQQTGPNLTDLTSALASLDQLRGKQESTMDIFQRGLDFAERISGNTDWKTDLIRTAKDALPMISQTVLSATRGMGSGPSIADPTKPQVEENAVPQLPPEAIVKQALVYLKKKCVNGMDPELIIDWIRENAEDYQPIIHAFFTMEFADIAKYDPEIGTGPFLPWFKQLYDGVRSAFSVPNSMGDDTGGSMGNGDNTGDHGEPITERIKK